MAPLNCVVEFVGFVGFIEFGAGFVSGFGAGFVAPGGACLGAFGEARGAEARCCDAGKGRAVPSALPVVVVIVVLAVPEDGAVPCS